MQTLQKVRKELHSSFGDTVSVQVFSGAARTGVDEARGIIGGWLGLE
jgi:GTP-binding protein